MIADKDTDFIYLSDLLRTKNDFAVNCSCICDILNKHSIKYDFLKGTQDIWARDYMPIQVSEKKFVEFRYDPDYLQGIEKDQRNLKTYPDIVCQKHNIKTIKSGLIVDGGNVVKSHNTAIMTDKVFTENRYNFTKDEVQKKLIEILELEKLVIVPWFDKDEEDFCGHTDGYVRFIDDKTVLVNHIYQNKSSLINPLKKAGLKVEKLNFNVKKENENNWAYLNFLQTKDIILIPKLDAEEDEQALSQLSEYFSDYASNNRIIFIPNMLPIIKEGGALNCISWTVKT
ncbi:MAG: agmatine deiminase family protein [Lutibacter sp.]|nr:agmatine deiminase family protein [Lutibacter sp.]